ncbi:MAG: FAD-binding oxidoreductase, partial [Phycisphaeraceae bacterium]
MIAQIANNLFWWGGVVLLGIVTLQSLVALGGSVQRWRRDQQRRRWRDEILRSQLSLARHRLDVLSESGVAWAGWRKFRVARKELENGEQNICSFYLEPHDGKAVPTFEPGQYLTFQARLPGEDRPLVRCYSLSAAPQEAVYRVSIRRVPPPRDSELPPGRMSSHFHDHVNVGDILDVKAPGGSFTLDTTRSNPVVLLAGGVGITPMLSMLNAVAASGMDRECWLFYGVIHGDDQIMKQHLRRINAEHPNIHVRLCYSNPREDVDVLGRDYDHAERVSVALMQRLLPSNNYDFYM